MRRRILLGKRRLGILGRFLISYIAVLIIPLVISLFIYQRTIHVIEDNLISANLSLLGQSRDLMDRYLDEVDYMIARLAKSSKIVSFLSMTKLAEGSPEVYRVVDAWLDLSLFRITNSFIKDLYLYSPSSNIIMSPYSAFIREDIFYTDSSLRYRDMDARQWRDQVLDRPHVKEFLPAQPVVLAGAPASMITYLQSLPLESPRKNLGLAIVLLDNSAIGKLLANVNLGENGWVYVADTHGTIMSSFSGAKVPPHSVRIDSKTTEGSLRVRMDVKDMVVSFTTSGYNGWRYVSVLPARYVLSKVDFIRRTFLLFAVVALLIGVAIAYSLAYRNAQPLREISETVKASLGGESTTSVDGYDSLKRGIEDLLRNRNELQDTLQGQFPLMRASVLERLLRGGFSDAAEATAALSHVGLAICSEGYAVIILRISGYGDVRTPGMLKALDVQRIVVKETLGRSMDEEPLTIDLDETRIALLLLVQTIEPDACRKKIDGMIDAVSRVLASRYDMRIRWAVGGIRAGLMEVGYSFLEAKQASEHRLLDRDERCIWFSDIPRESAGYYYPLEIEQKLINLIKAGESEEVERLIAVLHEENFTNRRLSTDMTRQLLSEMQGTVTRVIGTGESAESVRDWMTKLTCAESIDEMHACIRSACLELCASRAGARRGQRETLKREILAFLEEEHGRHDLNLYAVASRYSLKEAYLYHFFKETLGESFASYLENLRMRHACVMLNATDLSVEEIADRVGYNSSRAFRRAFKRIQGVLPSDFKQKLGPTQQ